MKIKIVVCAVTLLLLFPVSVFAVDIDIDDAKIEFCGHTGIPFIDSNNRTQVPLRITMESLGAEVDWNQKTQTAVVEKDEFGLRCQLAKPIS